MKAASHSVRIRRISSKRDNGERNSAKEKIDHIELNRISIAFSGHSGEAFSFGKNLHKTQREREREREKETERYREKKNPTLDELV